MHGGDDTPDDDRDTLWWIGQQYLDILTEQFAIPIAQFCIATIYYFYLKFTLVNVVIFIFKYVPTGLYAYRFIKDIYIPSRERIQQRRNEIEDIQLQIQIVKTKLSVRDMERAEQHRRSVERLRRVRARVRDVIAADDTLKYGFGGDGSWYSEPELRVAAFSEEEERDIIMKLVKELKYDQPVDFPDRSSVKSEYDCNPSAEPSTPENSFYTSLSDVEAMHECHVKIVKVTNVYKVAYLKQYIKLKRLRRASKQALLKKRMEAIKKMLDDWQNKLNMAINSKFTILNIDARPMDVVSHEGMGDYSTARGSTDSDSDMRNSCPDVSCDDYSLSWSQNPYGYYSYNYEDAPEAANVKDYNETQDYSDNKYSAQQFSAGNNSNMVAIVEETNSQMAVEEVQADEDACRYPDLIVL